MPHIEDLDLEKDKAFDGDDNGVLHALRNLHLFEGIDIQGLKIIQKYATLINLQATQKLAGSLEETTGKAYILLNGSLTANDTISSESALKLKEYLTGDIINLMAFYSDEAKLNEAFANENSKILAIDVVSLKQDKNYIPLSNPLLKNITSYFSNRLAHTESILSKTASVGTEAILQRLEDSKLKIAYGVFLVQTIILMCLYTLTLKLVGPICNTFIVSGIILFLISLFLIDYIRKSALPLHDFGITTDHWKQSIVEGLIATFLMLAAILLFKYFLIHTFAIQKHTPLIEMQLGFDRHGITSPVNFYALVVYLMFVPMQEFIVRGVLQSSIYRFILGSERYRNLASIFVSNFLFLTFHLHVSFTFAMTSFLPGLVWGWLFSRHKTLIGVTISHLILGFISIFVINIEHVFRNIGLPSLFYH